MSQDKRFRLIVVAPVYDDAAAAREFLLHLRQAFAQADLALRVLLVDDGSPTPLADQLEVPDGPHSCQVEVLRLRRNVGHQRAIALGAAYVQEHVLCEAMLVMDADGEDRPEDAIDLVARCREQDGRRILFAERTRRSETRLFQVLYRLYQLLHWVLTGIPVRVGNFSIVPRALLPGVVTLPALWNHYAAAIFQGRLPREQVPTVRGRRYSGSSKMNFVALVVHGLQAISVFIEVVTVRLLLTMWLLACGCGVLFVVALAGSLWDGALLPGWVVYATGTLLLVAFSLALGCFSLTLGLLAQRNHPVFIPIRDYRVFVEEVRTLAPSHE